MTRQQINRRKANCCCCSTWGVTHKVEPRCPQETQFLTLRIFSKPLCDQVVSAACSFHGAHLLEQRELGQCLVGALLDLQQPGLPHICIVGPCSSPPLPWLLKLCQAPAAQLLLPDLQPTGNTFMRWARHVRTWLQTKGARTPSTEEALNGGGQAKAAHLLQLGLDVPVPLEALQLLLAEAGGIQGPQVLAVCVPGSCAGLWQEPMLVQRTDEPAGTLCGIRQAVQVAPGWSGPVVIQPLVLQMQLVLVQHREEPAGGGAWHGCAGNIWLGPMRACRCLTAGHTHAARRGACRRLSLVAGAAGRSSGMPAHLRPGGLP